MLSTFRRLLLRLAVAGFACRALVPVGFMPAPLEDGGPIVVCHGGQAGAFFARFAAAAAPDRERHGNARAGHAAHLDPGGSGAHAVHGAHAVGAGDDPRGGHALPIDQAADADHETHAGADAWEHCSLGTAFSHAALTSDVEFAVLDLAHVPVRGRSSVLALPAFTGVYRARAPPAA